MKLFKLLSFCLLTIFLGSTRVLQAQFYYNDPCNNATGLFTPYGHAHYTGNGAIDPIGDGWLRLTNDATWQIGYTVTEKTFPSTIGVVVEFDFKVWNSRSVSFGVGDGFSVFLFDGDPAKTFNIGSAGGGLGYIDMQPAYLGVGIDEFGNFYPAINGLPLAGNMRANAISIADASYRYVAGTAARLGTLNTTLNYIPVSATRPRDNVYYRRVKVEIKPAQSPATGMNVKVSLILTEGGNYIDIIGPVNVPGVSPDLLKVGFASSTGSANAYHEVRNVIIRTPQALAVVKEFDCTNSAINTLIYKGDDIALNGILVNDTLPAGFIPTATNITGGSFESVPVFTTLSDGRRAYVYTINSTDYLTVITFEGNFSTLLDLQSSVSITPPEDFVDDDLNDNYSEDKLLFSTPTLQISYPSFYGTIHLKGEIADEVLNQGFEYKKLSDSSWTSVVADDNFEANITGLVNGKYEFRSYVEVACGRLYSNVRQVNFNCSKCL